MQSLVSELSGIIIILLAAIYAYLGFSSYIGKKKEAFLSLPVIILIYHFTAFLSIYLKTPELRVVTLYLAQVLLFLLSSLAYRKFYKNHSKVLFFHMHFLIITGFIFVTRLNFMAGVRQTVFASASLAVSLVIPFLIRKTVFLRNMGWLYAAVGIGSLLYVLVNASAVHGAKNWIRIFHIRFQPSEFVKIALIFMIASFLYVNKGKKQIVVLTGLTGAMVLLLVLSRDLGGALLFFVTFVVMVYHATGKKLLLLLYSAGGFVAAVAGYYLFSHVRVRVAAFVDPFRYIDDKGYQITQSLFGIGSGGWFGFGLGNGSPKSTPVVESDFIFSGISEEMGLLFGFCLILIYLCTFFAILILAGKTKNEFHGLISVGCLTMYSFQAFLSIGGAVKFVPSTGVTLPLISTGGSSMISMIFLFGIIQGLYLANGEKVASGARAKKPTRLTYVVAGLFVSLIAYLIYFEALVSPTIINNAYNRRLDLYAANVLRGKILSADGLVLAETKEDKKGNLTRIYPYKHLYSHVVGRNELGKTGVEAIMNYELFTSNDDILKVIKERLSGVRNRGDSVHTTLDGKLQSALDRAFGSFSGAGVMIEPETGRILSMVSKPDYDPETVKENFDALSKLSGHKAKLVNRATTGLYTPGSTFKLLTALAYLRENKEDKNFHFDCIGIFRTKGAEIQCYDRTKHRKEGLKQAFANSCNGAFAKIGLNLDKEKFRMLCEEALFNREIKAPLTVGKSGFYLDSSSKPEEVIQTAIGQGKTLITPFHNALLAGAVANKGRVMEPRIADKITSYDEKRLVKRFSAKEAFSLMSEKEAKKLKDYMRAVVTEGTAKKLSWLGYPIYGKTGTAEYKTESGEKRSHSWFIGFAEKNGKKIAVSFVVEGETRGTYTATDVAYKVFSEWRP